MTMTVTTVSNNKDDNIEMLVISSKKYQKASQNKLSSDQLQTIHCKKSIRKGVLKRKV